VLFRSTEAKKSEADTIAATDQVNENDTGEFEGSFEGTAQVSETTAIDTVSATLEMQTDLEAETNDEDAVEENEAQEASVLAN
jgi:hypothetical protein